MAPFDMHALGGALFYLPYFLIGVGFGAILEMSGFGDSRKLAAQFYMHDMTVLKVMFGAIITAAVLIFLSTSLGLLDFGRIYVSPTFLYPQIFGGVLLGIGFIIGGFCPGTSIVASSTLKIDGMFFALGVAIGSFIFGETMTDYLDFYYSGAMGRFTLFDWLGVDAGVVVFGLIAMALLMFYGAEISEAVFGEGKSLKDISLIPHNKKHIAAAGAILMLALIVMAMGQPTAEEKWEHIKSAEMPKIRDRAIYAHPAEVVNLKEDSAVKVSILDVRPEKDYNIFHIMDSRHITFDDINDRQFIKELRNAPDNEVVFVVSNGETLATKAWKMLRGQDIQNLYVIEGGINNWLKIYPPDPCIATPKEKTSNDEELAYNFKYAVGDHSYSAHPDNFRQEYITECFKKKHPEWATMPIMEFNPYKHGFTPPKYTNKVKIQKKQAIMGGCG